MAHSVVRQLCSDIVKAGSFALVVDGTTDITIQEQESIVVRYVDENLVPNEVFLGFFAQSNGTTGVRSIDGNDSRCSPSPWFTPG